MIDMENIEQTNEEEKSFEELKEETQKKVVSKLYIKLEELQEKLSNEELSPMKRFLLENKLAIIETRLERQLAKMDIKSYKEEYEGNKDAMYEMHNEELQEKQEELDSIFDEIEKQERLIEQKTTRMKRRKIDYNEINNTGKRIIHKKNTRGAYQFSATKKMDDFLQKQEEKLEELKAKKDLKKEEIINLKKEFIENEKEMDSEFSQQLKEYKPSIWQSFKNTFSKISNNFSEWRKHSKEERTAVKNAKKDARANARIWHSVENIVQNNMKMEEFKDRVNSHISLGEQKVYSEKIQEEIEHVEGEIIIEEEQK